MNSTPASLKLRFIALIIDGGLILSYIAILIAVALTFYYLVIGGIPALGMNTAHAIGFLSLTIPIATYFILSEHSKRHGSIGKQITKIKVISYDGNPLTTKQVIIRNIIKFLPWEYAHTLLYILFLGNYTKSSTLLFIGLIIANIIPIVYICIVLLRKDHRGPHDLAAGTIVVMN